MENQEKKSKLPLVIAIIIVLLIAASAAVIFIWYRGKDKKSANSGRLVYVQKVSDIVNGGHVGLETRFMGIVESQETKSVNKDSSKTVKEIYVKVGDSVKEGDELFIYDTQEMEMQLEQLELDLQGIYNRISSISASIDDLSNQRNSATSEDERLSLTSQINSYNASLNEENYNLSVKQLEIEKQKESINSAAVTAPMDGMIKSINNSVSDDYSYNSDGNNDGFITIMAEGDFRIKGTVSEQNIYSLTQGTPVIIRSRVNDDTWHGVITKIDLEPQKNNEENYFYMMSGESASKYSFYVNPDSTDGLMLGQHLYLEVDNGQAEVKEGLYIPTYMMILEEGGYFVWKQVDKHIEKTEITVGDYDEKTDMYLVQSGLTEEDFIAYPDYYIEDGCPVTTNYDEVLEQMQDDTSDIYPEGDGMNPDDFVPADGEYDMDGNFGGQDNIDSDENPLMDDVQTEFSTDYLTDEELMQGIDTGNDNDPENIENTVNDEE